LVSCGCAAAAVIRHAPGAAALATAIASVRRKPKRHGWSFGFEIIARTLKANAERISRLDLPEQRRHWAAMAQLSPVLEQVRVEPAAYGGVRGAWFIPEHAAPAPVIL
jgi:hypothetical protein